MSHPHSRRPILGDGPISPALVAKLRDWREDHQHNVAPELRRRRWFTGPSAHRKAKAFRAARRKLPK